MRFIVICSCFFSKASLISSMGFFRPWPENTAIFFSFWGHPPTKRIKQKTIVTTNNLLKDFKFFIMYPSLESILFWCKNSALIVLITWVIRHHQQRISHQDILSMSLSESLSSEEANSSLDTYPKPLTASPFWMVWLILYPSHSAIQWCFKIFQI